MNIVKEVKSRRAQETTEASSDDLKLLPRERATSRKLWYRPYFVTTMCLYARWSIATAQKNNK